MIEMVAMPQAYQNQQPSVDEMGEEVSEYEGRLQGHAARLVPGRHTDTALFTATTFSTVPILDTGATTHMFGTRAHFSGSLVPLSMPAPIFTADSDPTKPSTTFATHTGTVILHTYDGPLTLHNVYYVPKFSVNLISISKFINSQVDMRLYKGDNWFMMHGTRFNICHANDSFTLPLCYTFEAPIKKLSAFVASFSLDLLHERLGHVNGTAMMKLKDQPGITGLNFGAMKSPGQLKFCSSCALSKSTRHHVPSIPATRSKVFLGRVCADIIGPLQASSLRGATYVLSLIDDYSRHATVYFLKNKSDAFGCFQQYKSMMENESGKKILHLRTDRGGEFTSTAFANFLRVAGIQHELPAAASHEENGLVERFNRTIMERATTLLYRSGLPLHFWAEAVNTACYTYNLTPHSGNSHQVPQVIYFRHSVHQPRRIINYSNLRPFGCAAYVHIQKEHRRKLDRKAKIGVMLGYEGTAYRVLVDGVIESRRDVVFDEGHFPRFASSHTPLLSPASAASGITRGLLDSGITRDLLASGITRNLILLPALDAASPVIDSDAGRLPDFIAPVLDLSDDDSDFDLDDDDAPEPVGAAPAPRRSARIPTPRNHSLNLHHHAHAAAVHLPRPQNLDSPSYRVAMNGPTQGEWIDAMNTEWEMLVARGTGVEVDPKGRKVIPGKWLLTTKRGETGTLLRRKGRWVALGNLQVAGHDYGETFASVVRTDTFRILMAKTTELDLELATFDITGAFLAGNIDREGILVSMPTGYGTPGKVWELKRPLYGLKQAPRCWKEKLDSFLVTYGFHAAPSDDSFYLFKNEKDEFMYLPIHVDDGIIASNSPALLAHFRQALSAAFETKWEDNPTIYLGFNIRRDCAAGTLQLSQRTYSADLLEKFGMADCHPHSLPIKATADLSPATEQEIIDARHLPYRELVGGLNWLASNSRPDIRHTIGSLSSFCGKHSERHFLLAKGVLRYIKGTLEYALTYRQNQSFEPTVYSDANFAADPLTRRSVSAYVFVMCGAAVHWYSKRQAVVALSTTQAEFVALAETAKQAIWLRSILRSLSFLSPDSPIQSATIILGDNEASIQLAMNPIAHSRAKHIDIKWFFLRDEVKAGTLSLRRVPTDDNLADILTKSLGPQKHLKFTRAMGLELQKWE